MKTKYITLIIKMFVVIFVIFPMNSLRGQRNYSVAEDMPAEQVVSDEWKYLFDGETLSGWEAVRYTGAGEPHVRDGILVIPTANMGVMTGVRWVGDSIPANNYVIYYEARRVQGNDIFAGLTFPYKDSYASLILGGWRNVVNGISSIDGYDASENETYQRFSLVNNQWYQVQLRVTTDSIRAYIGKDEFVNLATTGKILHLRDDILDTGLTLWTYLSTGEIRNMRIKRLL